MFAFLSTNSLDFIHILQVNVMKKKHLPSQLKTIFFNKHGTCLLNYPRQCWEHLGQVLWSGGVSGKNSIRPVPDHLDFRISSNDENTRFWEMLRLKEIFSKERLLIVHSFRMLTHGNISQQRNLPKSQASHRLIPPQMLLT